MTGAAAGWVFYTTFPAPDMARKRTLGKLTIETVEFGGPKLTKSWVQCPMGIVSLAGVVRALWASGRDILGRCGTSPYVAGGSARFFGDHSRPPGPVLMRRVSCPPRG